MEPYQERVVQEKHELDVKITALEAFVQKATFAALPIAERNLLLEQTVAMRRYSDILAERIALFHAQAVPA